MMLRITPMMVAIKPGHQGEREGNRKTIVQGMPGRIRRTCGDDLVLFCTKPWVLRAPGIPCAFSLKVACDDAATRARRRGERRRCGRCLK
jgi:hypothetical protein